MTPEFEHKQEVDGALPLWCPSELGRPTSVDAVRSEPAHMVAAFSGGRVALFNLETQQRVLVMEAAGPPGERRQGGRGQRGRGRG